MRYGPGTSVAQSADDHGDGTDQYLVPRSEKRGRGVVKLLLIADAMAYAWTRENNFAPKHYVELQPGRFRRRSIESILKTGEVGGFGPQTTTGRGVRGWEARAPDEAASAS